MTWTRSPHSPSERCGCPNPNPGRPYHCAAAAIGHDGVGPVVEAAERDELREMFTALGTLVPCTEPPPRPEPAP